jgi:tetratricopeptide (TPR) repeat protein
MSQLKPIFFCAILVIIVAGTFSAVGGFAFINLDDNDYVTENPFITTGLTYANIHWAFTHSHAGHWHPITWLSHMLDCELFGLEAGKHHMVNLFFHISNVVLLFLVLRKLFDEQVLSFLAALSFGIHPLRIESVAWVSERKDVLSMFFCLLTILSYLFYLNQQRSYYAKFCYFLALCFFALGLGSKPMLITLPVLLLLLDYYPLKRFNLVEKLPFFALSTLSAAAAVFSQHEAGGLQPLNGYPLFDRLSNVFANYLIYLAKFFWPSSIGIFYPFMVYPPGVGAGALLSLIVISVVISKYSFGNRGIAVGWLWFIISLLPVVGIVQIGGQSYADRWSYIPHIGILILLICWAKENHWINNHKKSALAVALLFIIACGGKTMIELPYWGSSESLWRRTLEATGNNNFMAHTNLGVELERLGKAEEAIEHYEEAVRLNPTYPEALNNIGIVRAKQSKIQEAIQNFQKAVTLRPNFTGARYNLGLALYNGGDPVHAVKEWREVLTQDPNYRAAEQSLQYALRQFPDL